MIELSVSKSLTGSGDWDVSALQAEPNNKNNQSGQQKKTAQGGDYQKEWEPNNKEKAPTPLGITSTAASLFFQFIDNRVASRFWAVESSPTESAKYRFILDFFSTKSAFLH
jgi:hypothetical protein